MAHLKIPGSLVLVFELKRTIEKNHSVRTGLQNYIKSSSKDNFKVNFLKFWNLYEQQGTKSHSFEDFNLNQKALLELIINAVNGIPIYENLCELEKEMIMACEDSIQRHIQLMPIKLQIPLLLLVFPALLILLLVPALGLFKL